MNHRLRKRSQKAGLPPGSLIHIGDILSSRIKISIMEYSEAGLIEKEDVDIQQCLEHIETPAMTWIQVYGVNDPAKVAFIGNHFKLHPLILEDILNTGQRAKLDVYQDQLFIVVRMLLYKHGIKDGELKDEQVSIILGPNYLISFLEHEDNIFTTVKDRIRQSNNRIRRMGSDYLAYALLDTIVDHYFIVLEEMDVYLEKLEEELVSSPKPFTLQKIQHTKRDTIFLRKSIWPMREVISRFQRIDSPLVTSVTQVYLRDVYDHTIQAIDIIEMFRDIVSGMLDLYISNINIRTNDIMKVLTIVSTIFVPLTFISSLYGMNFEYMPELHTRWGYPLTLFIMLSVAVGMLIFFRRRHWI